MSGGGVGGGIPPVWEHAAADLRSRSGSTDHQSGGGGGDGDVDAALRAGRHPSSPSSPLPPSDASSGAGAGDGAGWAFNGGDGGGRSGGRAVIPSEWQAAAAELRSQSSGEEESGSGFNGGLGTAASVSSPVRATPYPSAASGGGGTAPSGWGLAVDGLEWGAAAIAPHSSLSSGLVGGDGGHRLLASSQSFPQVTPPESRVEGGAVPETTAMQLTFSSSTAPSSSDRSSSSEDDDWGGDGSERTPPREWHRMNAADCLPPGEATRSAVRRIRNLLPAGERPPYNDDGAAPPTAMSTSPLPDSGDRADPPVPGWIASPPPPPPKDDNDDGSSLATAEEYGTPWAAAASRAAASASASASAEGEVTGPHRRRPSGSSSAGKAAPDYAGAANAAAAAAAAALGRDATATAAAIVTPDGVDAAGPAAPGGGWGTPVTAAAAPPPLEADGEVGAAADAGAWDGGVVDHGAASAETDAADMAAEAARAAMASAALAALGASTASSPPRGAASPSLSSAAATTATAAGGSGMWLIPDDPAARGSAETDLAGAVPGSGSGMRSRSRDRGRGGTSDASPSSGGGDDDDDYVPTSPSGAPSSAARRAGEELQAEREAARRKLLSALAARGYSVPEEHREGGEEEEEAAAPAAASAPAGEGGKGASDPQAGGGAAAPERGPPPAPEPPPTAPALAPAPASTPAPAHEANLLEDLEAERERVRRSILGQLGGPPSVAAASVATTPSRAGSSGGAKPWASPRTADSSMTPPQQHPEVASMLSTDSSSDPNSGTSDGLGALRGGSAAGPGHQAVGHSGSTERVRHSRHHLWGGRSRCSSDQETQVASGSAQRANAAGRLVDKLSSHSSRSGGRARWTGPGGGGIAEEDGEEDDDDVGGGGGGGRRPPSRVPSEEDRGKGGRQSLLSKSPRLRTPGGSSLSDNERSEGRSSGRRGGRSRGAMAAEARGDYRCEDDDATEGAGDRGGRVDGRHLLIVGLVGIIGGFLGSVYVESTCHFATVTFETGDETFNMHYGMWKYSPLDSVFQGYTYCYGYDDEYYTSEAPLLSRAAGMVSSLCGMVALSVLWAYVISGASTESAWTWSVRGLVLSGACQMMTFFFFLDMVCQRDSCSVGPGAAVSFVVGLIWFAAAFEMHRCSPFAPRAPADDGDRDDKGCAGVAAPPTGLTGRAREALNLRRALGGIRDRYFGPEEDLREVPSLSRAAQKNRMNRVSTPDGGYRPPQQHHGSRSGNWHFSDGLEV